MAEGMATNLHGQLADLLAREAALHRLHNRHRRNPTKISDLPGFGIFGETNCTYPVSAALVSPGSPEPASPKARARTKPPPALQSRPTTSTS